MRRNLQGGDYQLTKSKVVVLGNGFLGVRSALHLAATCDQVQVIARTKKNSDAKLLEHGIEVEHALEPDSFWKAAIDASSDADSLITAIGLASPALAQSQPDVAETLTSQIISGLTGTLQKYPSLKLVYFSSGGTVYGDNPNEVIDEAQPLAPMGVYGQMHVSAESQLSAATGADPSRLTVARIANPYGEHHASSRGQGLVSIVIEMLKANQPITLIDSGNQVRDYVFVDDVAKAVAALATSATKDVVYNVGTGRGTSTLNMVMQIAELMGIEPVINFAPSRGFDPSRNVLDNTKLKTEFGIDFMTPEQGLLLTLDRFDF